MSLIEAIMLWEMNNPDKSYFDEIPMHAFIDKEALLDFIVMECGDLRVVDSNSGFFHERVKMFFTTHKWNIDKLCDSLEFDYLPLNNYHGTVDRKFDRDVAFASRTERDQTTDNVTDRDQIENENTARDVSTVEDITKNQQVHEDTTTDRDWTENGSSDEQDVHYISAYNDKESPELIGLDANGRPIYKFNDTEHDRDTIDISYQKKGTEDINVVADKTTDETQHSDETIDEDIQRDKTTQEDIVVKDVLDEDIDRHDATDEDIIEHKEQQGNNGKSYQSLIEEERKQAQFNIYKWILNHWFHEMVVSVW